MSKAINSEAYQAIWLIRRLFRALSQKSSENLEGLGISVADRAVLEFLYREKMLSVPEIAQRYKVSRQHVQVTVNSLLDKGLAVTQDNPRHKRSPHIILSSKGHELFEAVLKRDGETVDTLFSNISKKDIQTTRKTLQSLLNELS